MKTNEDLQKDVQDAIKWEPLLNVAGIGVTVDDGIVTLTGTVDNYTKKMEAENAAKNVAGVKAIVENIKVVLPEGATRKDSELAAEIVKALDNNRSVPHGKIKVKVENGLVYLEGEISWQFQREAARKSIDSIHGIKGLIDDMEVKSEIHDKLEEKLIREAFRRHWSLNAHNITVNVSGNTVKLTGHVSSLYQKEEASHIVWKIPGIGSVDNQLAIEYNYYLTE